MCFRFVTHKNARMPRASLSRINKVLEWCNISVKKMHSSQILYETTKTFWTFFKHTGRWVADRRVTVQSGARISPGCQLQSDQLFPITEGNERNRTEGASITRPPSDPLMIYFYAEQDVFYWNMMYRHLVLVFGPWKHNVPK